MARTSLFVVLAALMILANVAILYNTAFFRKPRTPDLTIEHDIHSRHKHVRLLASTSERSSAQPPAVPKKATTDPPQPPPPKREPSPEPPKAVTATTSGPNPPSQAFLAALQRYRDLHTRIVSGKDMKVEERRTVVLTPDGQLCNRLRSMMSAFLIGLLEDRAFFVHFQPGYYTTLASLFDAPGFEWDAEVVQSKSNILSLGGGVAYMSSGDSDLQNLVCGNVSEAYGAREIQINSLSYLGNFITLSETYAPRLAVLFPDGDVAGHVARALFGKPNSKVLAMLDEYRSQHWKPGVFRIALQIRSGIIEDHFPGANKETVREALFNFSRCAVNAAPDKYKDASWFVAADNDETRRSVKEVLEPVYHTTFFREFLRSNNEIGCQQALTDVLLVAEADLFVTTPHSSYGEFARTLASKPGYEASIMAASLSPYFNHITQPGEACVQPLSTRFTFPPPDVVQRLKCFKPDMLKRIP